MNRADAIEAQAAHWVLRRDAPGWSGDDQAALEAWLDAAVEHRVAWLRLRSAWQRADRLAALRHLPVTPPSAAEPESAPAPAASAPAPVASAPVAPAFAPAASAPASTPQTGRTSGSGPGPASHAARRPRRRRWPWAAAACLLALAGAGRYLDVARHTYATEAGGRQTVPLADGSRVELNTRTRLRAVVNAQRRVVWLEEGEAYFEVAHDPARPFVVHAGARRITVLGTRFSVRSEHGEFAVAVVEGRVRVEGEAAPERAQAVVLGGGDLARAAGATGAGWVLAGADDQVARELSWREGVLRFDQTRLADAVAQFNRYHRAQLVITDPAVADIRIGGSFDAARMDAFVRLVERGFGLRAEGADGEIRISRR